MTKPANKFTGNHTSMTPSAAKVSEVLINDYSINKLSPGIIKAGLKARRNGVRRVKIQSGDGYALVSVRGNTSIQELHVYSDTPESISILLKRNFPDWDIVH